MWMNLVPLPPSVIAGGGVEPLLLNMAGHGDITVGPCQSLRTNNSRP
jgi:hypothetical protein